MIALAYELVDARETAEAHKRELRAHLAWFAVNLEVPDRFNRTTSKGWYRRKPRG